VRASTMSFIARSSLVGKGHSGAASGNQRVVMSVSMCTFLKCICTLVTSVCNQEVDSLFKAQARSIGLRLSFLHGMQRPAAISSQVKEARFRASW